MYTASSDEYSLVLTACIYWSNNEATHPGIFPMIKPLIIGHSISTFICRIVYCCFYCIHLHFFPLSVMSCHTHSFLFFLLAAGRGTMPTKMTTSSSRILPACAWKATMGKTQRPNTICRGTFLFPPYVPLWLSHLTLRTEKTSLWDDPPEQAVFYRLCTIMNIDYYYYYYYRYIPFIFTLLVEKCSWMWFASLKMEDETSLFVVIIFMPISVIFFLCFFQWLDLTPTPLLSFPLCFSFSPVSSKIIMINSGCLFWRISVQCQEDGYLNPSVSPLPPMQKRRIWKVVHIFAFIGSILRILISVDLCIIAIVVTYYHNLSVRSSPEFDWKSCWLTWVQSLSFVISYISGSFFIFCHLFLSSA